MKFKSGDIISNFGMICYIIENNNKKIKYLFLKGRNGLKFYQEYENCRNDWEAFWKKIG